MISIGREIISLQNNNTPLNIGPTQRDLIDWDRKHVWHAFSQMAEYDGLIIDSAEGCWLTDIHGKRYLDGVSSMWCNIHGIVIRHQ